MELWVNPRKIYFNIKAFRIQRSNLIFIKNTDDNESELAK